VRENRSAERKDEALIKGDLRRTSLYRKDTYKGMHCPVEKTKLQAIYKILEKDGID